MSLTNIEQDSDNCRNINSKAIFFFHHQPLIVFDKVSSNLFLET